MCIRDSDYNEIDNILLLNGKDGLYLDDFLKVHSLLLEKPILVESISLFEASEMYKKIKIDEVDYSHLKIPTNNELLKLIEDWENYNDCSYYKN